MTFVAMHFDPPVKWMSEEELLALPLLGHTFMSIRGNPLKKFVDYNEDMDMWWYGEQYRDSKIKWYRVIVTGRKSNDSSTDGDSEQDD